MATNVEIKRYSNNAWDTIYPKANWNNMDNKPSTFTPSAHTHSQYLEKTGGTLSNILYSRSILPAVNNSYNLGTPDYKYNAIYGTGIRVDYAEVNTTLQVQFPIYQDLINAGYLRSDYESAGYPTEDFCKAICRWAINGYPNKGNIELIGSIAPNSTGTIILHLYSSSGKDSNNNPRYCSGIYLHLSGTSFRFGFSDYNWYYITLASTGDLNNYLPLSGGNMSGNINFGDNTRRIGQQDGSTLTRYNGNTVTLPSGNASSKGVAILADEGGDFGLLYIGSDGAAIANSGDNGYIFKVYDKDQNSSDFTSSSGLAFGVKQGGGGVYAQGNFEASGGIYGTTLYENNTALSSKYLQLAGGTLTGKLGFTNNDITRYDFVTNGYWSYSDTTATGMILITLPENIYSRMIKFKVSIFNYATQTSCEFSIGGYPYADGNWYNTFAYCEGNGDISKLPVNFFVKDSNNRFKVGIGSINTTWSYPKVYIKDVEIGHNDGSTLGTSWSITIVDTQPAEAYSSYSNTGFLPLAGGIIGSGGTGSGDSSTNAKLEVEGGIITIKNYGNTFSIGQRNASFVHFENSNGATNYFGNNVTVNGILYPYIDKGYYLGGANNQWARVYGETIYENGTSLTNKYLQLSGGTIANGSTNAPLVIKSNDNDSSWIKFIGSNNSTYGYLGVNHSNKPVFYDTSAHILAYVSDIPDISGKLDKSAFSLSGTTLTLTL